MNDQTHDELLTFLDAMAEYGLDGTYACLLMTPRSQNQLRVFHALLKENCRLVRKDLVKFAHLWNKIRDRDDNLEKLTIQLLFDRTIKQTAGRISAHQRGHITADYYAKRLKKQCSKQFDHGKYGRELTALYSSREIYEESKQYCYLGEFCGTGCYVACWVPMQDNSAILVEVLLPHDSLDEPLTHEISRALQNMPATEISVQTHENSWREETGFTFWVDIQNGSEMERLIEGRTKPTDRKMSVGFTGNDFCPWLERVVKAANVPLTKITPRVRDMHGLIASM